MFTCLKNLLTNSSEAKLLLEVLKIPQNALVAEIGAGEGKLAESMARQLSPLGKVYASEYDAKKFSALKIRFQKSGLSNLFALPANQENPNLPEGSFDVIYMSKVFHHFSKPELQLNSFFHKLKPEGRLVIIDFQPKWYLNFSVPEGVPKEYGGHGIYKTTLVALVENAGFRLDTLRENFGSWGIYCAIFSKNQLIAN
jgi:ubiquinone/menaquinone biosynthesis C-methylase UbiE